MKVLLATVILICYAFCVNGNRVKRGLSVEKQKKLVDELNKDREMYGRKTNDTYAKISYDPEMEKWLESLKDCDDMYDPFGEKYFVTKFKYNDVMKELKDDEKKRGGEDQADYIEYRGFFGPKSNRIGCSSAVKCSTILGKEHGAPENFIGRKVEVYGACTFRFNSSVSIEERIKIKTILSKGIKPPKIDKYVDIIGVEARKEGEVDKQGGNRTMEGSSGTVFNLILSLFSVLYI